MQISDILVSQRKLRAVKQLEEMIQFVKEGGFLPPITLIRCDDGVVQVQDGHHRLAAIWLSGRRDLQTEDYILVESDSRRPRFGTIVDLLIHCGMA